MCVLKRISFSWEDWKMILPGDQSLADFRKEVEEAKYENLEKEKV